VAAKVKLKDILDALEMPMDETPAFVDRETGEVITMERQMLHDAEEAEEDPEDEELTLARQIQFDPGRYPPLPDSHDIHEYSIMEDFIATVQDNRIREELFRAIGGRGAFRYFKDTIARYGISDQWYKFRANALTTIAREWCDDEDIEYIE
jgi:Uncharacterised protein family (UPF0158)